MKKGKHKPLFIVMEGIEGSGKSTQIELLAAYLRGLGREVITTREPGGTAGGEAIREMLVSGDVKRWHPQAEALLHNAARAEHIQRLIQPALEEGRDVLCDRFADSTYAYQAAGQGAGEAFISQLEGLVLAKCRPDYVLILDMPVEAALARADARAEAKSRYEAMPTAMHEKIRQAYLARAAASPETHRVIDASQDKEAVAAQIQAAISALLGCEEK